MTRYGVVARSLHWAVAGAIALQFLLSQLAELAEHDGERLRQLALLANHKSVGITILALAVLRLCWRLLSPPPELPNTMPRWQQRASSVTHWTLYGALFAMPVTGWLMSSASAYSVSWFGLFTLPDLVGPDAGLEDLFEEMHEVLATVLLVTVAIHILAALKHHFLDRDDVLRRMSSVPTVALLFAVFAAGALLLTPGASRAPGANAERPAAAQPARNVPVETAPDATPEVPPPASAAADRTAVPEPAAEPERTPQDETRTDAEPRPESGDASSAALASQPQPEAEPGDRRGAEATTALSTDAPAATVSRPAPAAAATPAPAPEPGAPAVDPAPPQWTIDYDRSYIRFTAEQAGANFTGAWTDWSADMRFADRALADSRFDVEIRVAGVDTRDEERDQTLMEAEWFDAAEFPRVTFRTRAMRRLEAGGFAAEATLAVKGERHPVTFEFDVAADGAQRELTGRARLDRLALGVGMGEWTDTEWVGRFVDVDVRVVASLP
jgi:cytochrome b561